MPLTDWVRGPVTAEKLVNLSTDVNTDKESEISDCTITDAEIQVITLIKYKDTIAFNKLWQESLPIHCVSVETPLLIV